MDDNGPNGRVTSSVRGGGAGVEQQEQRQGAEENEHEAAREADRAGSGTASDDPSLSARRRLDGRLTHEAGVYAQTGDVDKDGEIIDELRARLARAIGVTVGEVDADAHLDAVLGELARAQVRAVNVLAQNAAGLRP